MHARTRSWTLLLVAATVVPNVSASAQRLIVDVRDSVLRSGVPGALVSAVERASGAVAFGVTNEVGRVTLALTRRGEWTTTVRRIGIFPARAPAATVEVGQAVLVALNTTSAQFRLPAVQVTAAAPECTAEPVGDGRVAVLWDQLTLALRATTASAGMVRVGDGMHVSVFERDMTLDRTRRAERTIREGPGVGRPFYAAHPESLAARGYVQRDAAGAIQYFAPDETVMLSDGFIRTHCFHAPASDADSSFAQLRFKPVCGRDIPDVAGTAFIDALTGELRRVEFQYVNVDRFFEGRRPDAGGDVAFLPLSDGRWIVTAWTIRMPTYMRVPGRVERSLIGYREVGGTVRLLSKTTELEALRRESSSSSDDAPRRRESTGRALNRQRRSARDVERGSGFTMRSRGGPGIFLDSTALSRTAARTAIQLLQGLAGTSLISAPTDMPSVPAEADPDLAREWRAGAELPMMPTGNTDAGAQLVCLVKVYLDGRRSGLAQLSALPAQDVAALEFYRSPREVPAGYRREGNRCGTAMFWSFEDR